MSVNVSHVPIIFRFRRQYQQLLLSSQTKKKPFMLTPPQKEDEGGQKLWEKGFPDYMGAHAFDNILQRLQQSVQQEGDGGGVGAGHGIVVNIVPDPGLQAGAKSRAGSEDPEIATGPVTTSPVTDLSENSVYGDDGTNFTFFIWSKYQLTLEYTPLK